MLILDQLWDGELDPSGRRIRGDEYSRWVKEMAQAEDRLLKVLSPEGKSLFEAFDTQSTALTGFLERDAFYTGFRMAGLLLLDILGSYNG